MAAYTAEEKNTKSMSSQKMFGLKKNLANLNSSETRIAWSIAEGSLGSGPKFE